MGEIRLDRVNQNILLDDSYNQLSSSPPAAPRTTTKTIKEPPLGRYYTCITAGRPAPAHRASTQTTRSNRGPLNIPHGRRLLRSHRPSTHSRPHRFFPLPLITEPPSHSLPSNTYNKTFNWLTKCQRPTPIWFHRPSTHSRLHRVSPYTLYKIHIHIVLMLTFDDRVTKSFSPLQ